jgi:hypothetical protein
VIFKRDMSITSQLVSTCISITSQLVSTFDRGNKEEGLTQMSWLHQFLHPFVNFSFCLISDLFYI